MAEPNPSPIHTEPKSLPLTISCMPNGDSEARMWLTTFAECVAKDPEAVGATIEQSQRISALVKAFDEALSIANCECTRTKPNIRAKDLARSEAVLAVRELVNTIKANPLISDVQLVCLGIPTEEQKKRRAKAKERKAMEREAWERSMSRSERVVGTSALE